MSGSSWQARTAVALLIGAAGEGLCVLLAAYVAGGFIVATFLVALALGWWFGPWIGLVAAGVPPLGIALVSTGDDDTFVSRLLTAVAVVLMLGFSAWLAGRVRERYGKPPWGSSPGVSE